MNIIEEHEKARNLAAAFQSFIVGTAVIIGGCWTAWEFYQLDRIGTAKAELIELQNKADAKAVINISLEARNIVFNEAKYILVKAILSNSGKKDAYLDYSSPVVSVSKLNLSPEKTIEYTNKIESRIYMPTKDNKLGYIPNALIRDGEIKEYPFIIPVNDNGLYVIRFVAKVAEENQRKPGNNNNYDGEWSHQIVHVVD